MKTLFGILGVLAVAGLLASATPVRAETGGAYSFGGGEELQGEEAGFSQLSARTGADPWGRQYRVYDD